MNPILRAKEFYETDDCVDRTGDYPTFAQYLDAFLVFGFVLSTPDLFVCARPVDSKAPQWEIDDPLHEFSEPDTWFVALAAGDISKLWDVYPRHYPLAMWYNNGRRYLQPTEKAKRILTYPSPCER